MNREPTWTCKRISSFSLPDIFSFPFLKTPTSPLFPASFSLTSPPSNLPLSSIASSTFHSFHPLADSTQEKSCQIARCWAVHSCAVGNMKGDFTFPCSLSTTSSFPCADIPHNVNTSLISSHLPPIFHLPPILSALTSLYS